ncbi:MAG: hypothetical protein Kow0099_31060 [Candidatus Abyssubacteria bacterium]
MKDELAKKLFAQIEQIHIIDTHEHLMNRQMLCDLGFNLIHAFEFEYLRDDLQTLGMDPNLLLGRASEPDSLIPELLPLLKQTRNTTYFRALFRAFRDLHGLVGDCLEPVALHAASRSISAAYEKSDWYPRVIRDTCRIRYLLRDMDYLVAEDDFVKPVIRMDSYLILRHRHLLQSWLEKDPLFALRLTEAGYQERVRTFDDYLAVMDADFRKALEFGAVAIKVGIAYNRTLQFDEVPIDEANLIFQLPDEKTTWTDIKRFQDFIMFRIIETAAGHNLPVQIHTGLLAGGTNTLSHANPLHLTNIFLTFPHARFDVFHGGFPFTGELGSLALMFPNVYLDTCWLPLISYAGFKQALHEWLSYVPAGKFLWGGDCFCAEGIYGAVVMMREALAEVLAQKVRDDEFDEELALYVARRILNQNAAGLFRLEDPNS